jgi:oligopeptide transport system permease protein
MVPVTRVIGERLPPTMLLNIYSLLFSMPLGILIGIWAAVKKNKPTDHIISTLVMLFISVPSYVLAFIMQYFLGYKLGALPIIASSLHDAGGSYFNWTMTRSLIMPTLALSFGTIAGFTRSVRAELTEAITSDYMLLARVKGLTKARAISRHAMKNAMVPILPGIIGTFLGILGGSLIIETIFSVPGVGSIYLRSVTTLDYDVFIGTVMFYLAVGLTVGIIVDLSYGFIDPRIKMGER